jgi:Flp pilus assembly protein TadD
MIKGLPLFLIIVASGYLFGQERGAMRANSESSQSSFNKVHGLLVGVSEYQEVPSLDWAHNDAYLMERILKETFAANLGAIYKHTDKEATDFSITSSIYKLVKTAKEKDLVVVYLAGHGDVSMGFSGDNEGYFLAHNASKSREYEFGGTVSFEAINKFINGLTSRGVHVWLITDACRSGKIIDADGASATLDALIKGYQSTTKFISCQPNELSYEYDSLQHGAFTYFLAKGLAGEADNIEANGQVSAKELDDYLALNVRRATNKRQNPTIFSADRFADLMPVNDSLASYFKRSTDDVFIALAAADVKDRSGGDDQPEKSIKRIAFEDALMSGDLYGSERSAYGILEDLVKNNKESDEVDYMQEQLVNKILIRVQEQINIFLSDRPTLGGQQDFSQAAKDLQVVLSLLDAAHPYYEKMERRKNFFESMIIVENKDFQNYLSAEKQLLQIEKEEPNAAYIHQGLAMLYLAMNNKSKAEAQLNKAKEKITTWEKPNNTTAHLKILAGELDQAIEIIENSSNYDLKGSDIIFLKIELYTAGNQLQKAEEELQKLNTASNYSKAEFFQLEAKLNELKGRVRVAEDFYLKAIEEDKNNAALLAELGDVYRKDGDTALAVKYFKKAIKINKSNQIARNGLAILQPKTDVSHAQDINYYSVEDVQSAIDYLLSQNEDKQALKVIEKAIAIGKWNAELHFLKGNILYRLDEKNAAQKSWETALKLNKHHLNSAKNLIMYAIENGNKKEAEAIIINSSPNFSQSAEWKTIQYNAYMLMQPNLNREDLLQEALLIDSTNVKIYEWMYELDLKASNYASALNNFKQVQRLGGGKIDSIQFLLALKSQFEKEVNMRNRTGAINGLNLIERFDRNYIIQPLVQGARYYYKGDYKAAMTKLNRFERYYFILRDGDKVEHKRIKGYVLLEQGFMNEAVEHFKFINSVSRNTEYTGISMAYYMMGKGEGVWLQYFKKDPKLFKFNQTARERFKRMDMNSGYRR